MKNKIIYSNRYSDTDQPDDRNRWMRRVSYNDLYIGSISMEIFKNNKIKYFLISNFPINDSIGSNYANSFDTYVEAQSKIESLWDEFKNKIK